MRTEDGRLVEQVPVEIPSSVRTLLCRQLPAPESERFHHIQLLNIAYESQGLRIRGYMALPPDVELPAPALIFNRGGSGERSALTPTTAAATIGVLAAWGYVAIASQYRGAGGSEGTEEWGGADVEDALALIPLLDRFAFVDTDRLGIVGGSRGGMMVLQMLRRTTRFRAAVTIGAPTMLHTLPPTDPLYRTMLRFLPPGASPTAAAVERSAVLWTEELCKTTPLLVLHGTEDKKVPPEHALYLGLSLQRARHPYKLILYDNADHILAGRWIESNADIRWWLDHYVRHRAPLPKAQTT
ncbi:MAG: prolyl oligopeptidase family serine peptidase [Candidatus Kapabacteria bacterium]|nr:prolyl oligopeptidase family serine peptidase [Candidatus Kapabacteria bacterium]MDW7996304.1 prolyl oligopeptidase family serine peptidase [Bacteroidota bacterium]